MADKSLLGTDEIPLYPVSQDEKNLGLLSHIITLVSSFIAPLIIYILKKNESEFVAAHAKESLNFQITIVIVCFICIISIVGILLLWVVGIYSFILVIVATVRASEGRLYKYPFCLRLLK
ncbi:MAG: DUF4870 domain-containing protein [Chitinophaga sp.]|jgi:uncharacterized protein|nr:DUF4870 domain-containing protein [Chitinophaga sp.]